MAFFINQKIAEVNTLSKVTLAHNPQFLSFTSVQNTAGNPFEATITVNETIIDTSEDKLVITFTENDGSKKHEFRGTHNEVEVNIDTFLLVYEEDMINEGKNIADRETAKAMTTQNFYSCLLRDSFFRNNFEISIDLKTDHLGNITSMNKIFLKAKHPGDKYKLTTTCNFEEFMSVSATEETVNEYDSIDYDSGKYTIELEVYTDTGIFLGEDDNLSDRTRGKYLTSLKKSYHKNRVWFDLNTLFGKKTGYSDKFINCTGWCDTGTIQDFRIIGKRSDSINSEIFYASEILYVINGYNYTLDKNNLDNYIFDVLNYDGKKVKPLSNSPVLNHVRGQKHFFNFILKDDAHNSDLTKFNLPEHKIGLMYRFYTQSGSYIGEIIKHEQNQQQFNIINTIEINLDAVIEEIQKSTNKVAGKAEIMLSDNGYEVSEPMALNVLPDNSYSVKDFAFLNRLGGWDCFNFGNRESVEFKATADTYYQTLLPEYESHKPIETVSHKNVSETFIVRSQPVKREIAEWLRELSASKVVYDLSTNRYIIVSEMTLKYNSFDDLFIIEMKYRYSDNFNSSLLTESK